VARNTQSVLLSVEHRVFHRGPQADTELSIQCLTLPSLAMICVEVTSWSSCLPPRS
jgi:hypothetical protein